MTARDKALLASSPGLAVLLVSLGWLVLDPKGDTRRHLTDRAIRTIDRARAAARF